MTQNATTVNIRNFEKECIALFTIRIVKSTIYGRYSKIFLELNGFILEHLFIFIWLVIMNRYHMMALQIVRE